MPGHNPYADAGSSITGERFIGRVYEVRAIEDRIFGPRGFGSMAVVGLPRIGKTSLVAEAIRRAESQIRESGAIVVRANVGAFDSVDGLFRGLIEDLIEAMRSRGLVNETVDRRVNEALTTEIDFSVVRRIFKLLRQAGVRPVCVLDEFDAGRRVFEKVPQCFHWLRELCSDPDYKAAIVLVAKRRLHDIARLAGHDSNYWSNVLMTLPIKPFSDRDLASFFSKLEEKGVFFGDDERREILDFCGGNPFLLDNFAFQAWGRVAEHGGQIPLEWIRTTCGPLIREYFDQVSTVLEDGPMLSKATQVLVGPQWDVTSDDVDALCELGVVLRDERGRLRGCSRAFEDHLRLAEGNIDTWALWRDTERALRTVLDQQLQDIYGEGKWPNALGKAYPNLKHIIENCEKKRTNDQKRFGTRATPSLLAYTYPMDLYNLMCADWKRFGQRLLGADKQGWGTKFAVLSKVRTPLAHNREESASNGDREQARGICRQILENYQKMYAPV